MLQIGRITICFCDAYDHLSVLLNDLFFLFYLYVEINDYYLFILPTGNFAKPERFGSHNALKNSCWVSKTTQLPKIAK